MLAWRFVLAVLAVAPLACVGLDGLAGGAPGDDAGPRSPSAKKDDGTSPKGPVGGPQEQACETGKQACGGTCVDTRSDAANCGRCGRDCAGGACSQSTCQPVELASDLDDPQGLAVGPDALWVTLYSNKVVRIPKKGGAAEVVTSDTTRPGSIAVATNGDVTTALVWGESYGAASNVVFCDVPCRTPRKQPAGGDVGQVAVSGTQAFYTWSSSTAGTVQRCNIDGCGGSPYALIEGVPRVYGLVVSGGQLVFGVRGSPGAVRRASAYGGNGVTDLIRGIDNPTILATDGTTLYAAVTGANVIARCPLTGCSPGQLATIALAQNPHSVATDGVNVYWTNGLAKGGSVSWCPVNGCTGAGNMLAANQENPFTVAVDAEAVYWTTAAGDGKVMKIARP